MNNGFEYWFYLLLSAVLQTAKGKTNAADKTAETAFFFLFINHIPRFP